MQEEIARDRTNGAIKNDDEKHVTLKIIFSLGVLFSFIASIMAFLITYSEYSKHFKEARMAFRVALQTGIVTFLFFCALSLVVGLALDRMLSAR